MSPEEVSLEAKKINAFGHSLLKNIYKPDAISEIEKNFDAHFSERLAQGRVQSRDYKRYVCKLPIEETYREILNNDTIHHVLNEVLGEDYVLFNFNSHSSLSGSSNQIMHIDSNDPVNSDTLVHNYANVAFLHIPLIDTNMSHGATKMWPATIQKINNDDLHYYHWVEENLPCSELELERGDVIIKLDNCIHAGGKNTSDGRRHILTLIFARKDYYLNNNSGMLPGLTHQDLNLPYRIASHCETPLKASTEKFTALPWAKINNPTPNAKFALKARQSHVFDAITDDDLLQALSANNLTDANTVMNLFQAFAPLAQMAFGSGQFKIQSVRKVTDSQAFTCNDQGFLQTHQNTRSPVVNNDSRTAVIRIALNNTDGISIYPGNKTACSQAVNNPSFAQSIEESISLKKGDAWLSSGALPYAINDDSFEYIEVCYSRPEFEASYENRIWIEDSFALSLPTPLAKMLRYNNIYITQEKYKDFEFSKISYIFYVTFNVIEQYRMKNKLLGAIMKVGAGTALLPAILYLVTRKTIPNMLAKT